MAEEINMVREFEYCVHLIGPLGTLRMIKLKAKKVVMDDSFITFYDRYGCVSGQFRKDTLLGYAKKEE